MLLGFKHPWTGSQEKQDQIFALHSHFTSAPHIPSAKGEGMRCPNLTAVMRRYLFTLVK